MIRLEQDAAEKLTALGWNMIKNGWPDFLAYRTGANGLELMAVEVKSATDKVRPEQRAILEKLAEVMPVYVLRACVSDGELREHRINPGARIAL